MTKKKDDDLMFGDRLVPGPVPPVPGPAPAPGPIPPPGPHPAPGPIPPPPPPGLPTYPTAQFIEERFHVLRNEHTGIKNAAAEIKRVADENTNRLNDLASITTNGFANTVNAISAAKTSVEDTVGNAKDDLSGEIAGVDSKAASIIEKVDALDGKVTQSFTDTNTNISNAEEHVKSEVTTRSDALDAAVKAVHDKIGHGEVTVEAAVQRLQETVDSDYEALSTKVSDEHTSTRNHVVEQRTFLFQDVQEEHRKTKTAVGDFITAARNHVEDDVRSALGMEATRERTPIWDKINGVETKVDAVATTTTRSDDAVAAIHTETTSIKSTVEASNTVAGNIKSDTTSIKSTVEANGTVANNVKSDTASIKTTVETTATAVSGVAGNVSEVKGALTTMSGTLTALNGTLTSIASDAEDAKENSARAATAEALADVAQSVNIIRGSVAGEGSNPIAEIKAAVTNVEYGNQALANLLTDEDFGLRAIKIMVNTLTVVDSKLDTITAKLDEVETNVNDRLTAIEAALDTLNEQVALLVSPEESEEEQTDPVDPVEP